MKVDPSSQSDRPNAAAPAVVTRNDGLAATGRSVTGASVRLAWLQPGAWTP